ncbi:MAG: hypothetical protein ABIQ33_14360 [Caldimonas sp.]
MPILEGTHMTGSADRSIGYRIEYEVIGNTIHFVASFTGAEGPPTHEGQFDFDRSRVDAATAVDAFMQNHIAKDDFDLAP